MYVCSVAAVAREPRNVEHTFIIISNNITARLSWDEPDSDSTHVQLSGYRVVWGQLVQSDPIQMDSAALTKVLPKVRASQQLLHQQAPSIRPSDQSLVSTQATQSPNALFDASDVGDARKVRKRVKNERDERQESTQLHARDATSRKWPKRRAITQR